MRLFCIVLAIFACADSYLKHHRSRALTRIFSETLGDLLKYNPSDNTLKTIDKVPSKRLSVSDLSALAGYDLRKSQNELKAIAYLSGARLEVTGDGEIIYNFSNDFRSEIMKRSFIQRLKALYRKNLPIIVLFFRISFGVAILASLAVMAATFVFVLSSSQSSDRDDKKRSSSSSFTNSFYSRSPFDYMIRTNRYVNAPVNDQGGVSFIESFFSFVFGDGDPNANFAQKQLQEVSKCILRNNGVVSAEQLAPYMDPPLLEKYFDSGFVDESWVLPALIQLGGNPIVTQDGDILYEFSDFIRTSTNLNTGKDAIRPLVALDSERVMEQVVPFSLASPIQLSIAGVLGLLNLVGAGTFTNFN